MAKSAKALRIEALWAAMADRANTPLVYIEGELPDLNGRVVLSTGVACPKCAAEGSTNKGGNTPTLEYAENSDRNNTFCIGRHGFIRAA